MNDNIIIIFSTSSGVRWLLVGEDDSVDHFSVIDGSAHFLADSDVS